MKKSKLVRVESVVRFIESGWIALTAALLLVVLILTFAFRAAFLLTQIAALLVATGAVIVVAEVSRAFLRHLINRAQ